MTTSPVTTLPTQALLFPELANAYTTSTYRDLAVSILVVDDEKRARQSVCDLIKPTGYRTIQAASVKEALDLLKQRPFTLALVDLNLTDGSGQEILNFVQEQELSTRLIVISGESTFSNATEALRRGACDFIRKPYLPTALLDAVSMTIEKAELQHRFEQVHEQLRGSEELHRFIVNNSPDIIYMLDEQGRFSFINNRAESLLGYNSNKLIGQHYSTIVFSDDHEKARFAFNERRTNERNSKGVELRLLNQNNSEVTFVEARAISVELTAMGVYTTNHSDSTEFIGTYGVIRDVSERKRSEALAQYHRHHDHMTGLPNRTLFNDRLQMALAQAKRSDGQLAIMFLDVDRFRLINDSIGHLAGDNLLQMITKSLKQCLREEDTLARVGGDEFLLLLPTISNGEDTTIIGQKILDLTATPLSYLGNDIRITFSIGIATYPQHGSNIEELVRHAGIAMSHVKQSGRNNYNHYRSELRQNPCQSLELENDLHQAIANDELQLYFQPQIDIQEQRIVGLEALVRWNHAEKGIMLPSLFVPIAEQTRLICDLGNWVLERACAKARYLQDRGFTGLKIAINVSMQQLNHGTFPKQVMEAIARHGLKENCIEIEITESSIMQDMHKAVEVLTELANKGINIAIDDFGTGYSSLSYLRTLPIHTLKIDRSFIQSMSTDTAGSAIVTAILAMAKGLKMNCIAEGVETDKQKDELQRAGCRIMQGYYYSQAQPLEKLIPYLQKARNW
ncbi:MAG: EAL domain-containing protein [Desulfuromonadales bacterium]|nr:EAL domain-containing protein [Desulfuromonadales bacterium]